MTDEQSSPKPEYFPTFWYRLDPEIGDGRVPIPCDELFRWGRWFEEATEDGSRFVGKTQVGILRVSTVFLGLDHGALTNPDAPPILFETMVFDESLEPHDEFGRWFWRGSTWEDAHWNHKETVAAIEKETGCAANEPAGE